MAVRGCADAYQYTRDRVSTSHKARAVIDALVPGKLPVPKLRRVKKAARSAQHEKLPEV